MAAGLRGAMSAARSRFVAGGRPLRFLLAGGVNTLFGLAIFPLLLWAFPVLHSKYMLGLILAQALSLCFAFAMYKLTVFRTHAGTAGEFGRFLPFYLVAYAVNIAVLPLLVKGADLDPIVAQLGFSVVLMVSGYFWHSRITFRPRENR